MPSAENRATSVQPSLARGGPRPAPTGATKAAAAGWPTPRRAPSATAGRGDRPPALAGNDVPGRPAADGHGVQALVVAQPVDLRLPGGVRAQHGEDAVRL